jgi:hypothetical protein
MDIDFNKIKKALHIKLDLYDDFKLQNTEEDMRKLGDVQEAIKESSKTCFKQCVSLNEPEFSKKEEKCVRNCVFNMIDGLDYLIKKHDVILLKKNLEKEE